VGSPLLSGMDLVRASRIAFSPNSNSSPKSQPGRRMYSVAMLMLREPRGYPLLCCNLIVPPKHPDAAAGFIIMEQVEYPVMSGGNTIAVATVLLETGMIPMREPFTEFQLEVPAGLIPIRAECRDGKVKQVTFENVPAFAAYLDAVIDVPELGRVTVDVAWGGMFYVIADVRQFEWLQLMPAQGREITRVSALILRAAQDQLPVEHPDYPGIGITISQLSGPTSNSQADMKNAVTVASGPVDFANPATWTGGFDRCPCGTGTCAKMATLHAKGELKLNRPFRHEGILGLVYTSTGSRCRSAACPSPRRRRPPNWRRTSWPASPPTNTPTLPS
jgi:proline racemase